MPNISKITSAINKHKVKFIYLQFTDVTGSLKSVSISADNLSSVAQSGNWFDGSSIEGFGRIFESDMVLKPDLNTFSILPWTEPEKKAARIICDISLPDGRPFHGDPRFALKKILATAKKMGFTYNIGPEVEFFLFERDKLPHLSPHDSKSYFDYTTVSRATDICEQVVLELSNFGIKGEVYHHEVAPGQHEIGIKYDDALKSAENIITLKNAIKAHAAPNTPLMATFMPKPIQGMNGSGMHIHQSLFNNNKNIFYNGSDKYNLSATAYHFMAGQLKHAKAMCAVLASTVNSYKRLVPGYEAPCYICWGRVNRSALIRIPSASPDKKAVSARAELRCPDPYCNPYLAFTVMLAAGLDGIKRKMIVPKPVEENVFNLNSGQLKNKKIDILPTSLEQALKELDKDDTIKQALGPEVLHNFIKAKKKEIACAHLEVTPWEIEKYL
ncbi:glutamine synthetase beta-grasp domain-containing protein [Patescibacteria group bacterium]|nr:glutamine synthetase beta-grasp domain-containing protein [Patescibacteria group bacterium]MBU0964668.1 glutamine synthetase beta-grasp domain-containing protein [Patescibacteria group bacterium]